MGDKATVALRSTLDHQGLFRQDAQFLLTLNDALSLLFTILFVLICLALLTRPVQTLLIGDAPDASRQRQSQTAHLAEAVTEWYSSKRHLIAL